MSSVTTQTEVEAPSPTRQTPKVRPLYASPSPATRRGFAHHWPLIAMILSICLFAAVFVKTVLNPAAETLASSSNDHWTQGP